MMTIALFLCFFVFIFFDIRLLKRQNESLFLEKFRIGKNYMAGFFICVLLLIIMTEERIQMASIIVVIFLLPAYLIKRERFLAAVVDASNEFWLAADAFGVILKWIFAGVIIATVTTAYFQFILQFDSQLGELLISGIGSSMALILLIYRAASRFSPNGFFYNVGLRKNGNSAVTLFLIPFATGITFALLSGAIVYFRKDLPSTPLSEMISDTRSAHIFILFLFMALAVAPLIEEIVFRGYFFHVLKQLKGVKSAVICVSLSFAFLHVGQYWGDWLAIVMVAGIGFALTGLRAWTNSTIASTVGHYVYNGFVTIFPMVFLMVNNPAYFRYQIHYGELNFGQKEELLLKALNNNNEMAEIYYELALLYGEIEDKMPEAITFIDRALLIYPEDRLFLETKASILESLHRYGEALIIRKKILENAYDKGLAEKKQRQRRLPKT